MIQKGGAVTQFHNDKNGGSLKFSLFERRALTVLLVIARGGHSVFRYGNGEDLGGGFVGEGGGGELQFITIPDSNSPTHRQFLVSP